MIALRSALVTIAILLGLGLAAAQQGGQLAGPEQKAQQEKAQQTDEGRAGTTEPSSHADTSKPAGNAVFVDGKLVVPGAPADSQTVPAKYSARNAELDALPSMAFPLPLTDEQRQRIRDAVKNTPAAQTNAQATEVLSDTVDMRALPDQVTAEIPILGNLGYVRAPDRVLLISPANRVVVGEIKD